MTTNSKIITTTTTTTTTIINTRKRKHASIDNNDDDDDTKNFERSLILAYSNNKPKRHKKHKFNPLLNSLSAKEIESAFLLVTNLTVERTMMFAIIDEVYRSFPLKVLQQLQYTSEAEHEEIETRVFKIKNNDKRLKKAHERWQLGLNTLLRHPHYHRRYIF